MKYSALLFALLFAPVCVLAEITVVSPAAGSIVSLLKPGQAAFLAGTRAERREQFADESARKELAAIGSEPQPVTLEWKYAPDAQRPRARERFVVEVRREPDGLPVFRKDASTNIVEVYNLEIGRKYSWTVHAVQGDQIAESRSSAFQTEDRAPRLLRIPNVQGSRDIGGRIGLDGRKVRQGMVIRTSGLNENAYSVYCTREELLAEDKDGVLVAREKFLEGQIAALRKWRENPGSIKPTDFPLGKTWACYRPAKEAFDKNGVASIVALGRDAMLPAELCGAKREDVAADENGRVAFNHREAGGPLVAMQKVVMPESGVVTIGCGADWFWSLHVNGAMVHDVRVGNNRWPVSSESWIFPLFLEKGENILVATVYTGTEGWAWCAEASPAQPLARVLSDAITLAEKEHDGLFKVVKTRHKGEDRFTEEGRAILLDQLGICTEIDLRSDGECFGMTGSPLGDTVRWEHVSSSAYGGMQSEWGREQFAKVFKVFLDPKAYPIDFHCIAGQDRTGAVAFIIEALLGVEEEELYRDWEATCFWNSSARFSHKERFDNLISGFDALEGKDMNEKVENYVLSLGFTREQIEKLRDCLLEPPTEAGK